MLYSVTVIQSGHIIMSNVINHKGRCGYKVEGEGATIMSNTQELGQTIHNPTTGQHNNHNNTITTQ